jgi:hypothetical protein
MAIDRKTLECKKRVRHPAVEKPSYAEAIRRLAKEGKNWVVLSEVLKTKFND